MERKHNPVITKEKARIITLIVGLGNPGSEYENTYHNVGFSAVDFLTNHEQFSLSHSKTFSTLEKDGIRFIKPMTFMNDSGRAVADALHYFKKKSEYMCIIHDDVDIPIGSYKLQFARGAAGHHGIESIITVLGSTAFWRVRIGIGKENISEKKIRASSLVLHTITKNDQDALAAIFREIKELLL
ncbi:MAG: aminoacyl-tRNA hydrolase [Candidatus Paceibacterota bacterium]|jgi:PTH1 family peptidyl-tRNA hydrolase